MLEELEATLARMEERINAIERQIGIGSSQENKGGCCGAASTTTKSEQKSRASSPEFIASASGRLKRLQLAENLFARIEFLAIPAMEKSGEKYEAYKFGFEDSSGKKVGAEYCGCSASNCNCTSVCDHTREQVYCECGTDCPSFGCEPR